MQHYLKRCGPSHGHLLRRRAQPERKDQGSEAKVLPKATGTHNGTEAANSLRGRVPLEEGKLCALHSKAIKIGDGTVDPRES